MPPAATEPGARVAGFVPLCGPHVIFRNGQPPPKAPSRKKR